ncbi:MAG: sensor domain-containing diguanylate cyclase [Solirubrobacterales bacterium]
MSERRTWTIRGAFVVFWLVAVTGMWFFLSSVRADSERGLQERTDARTTLSARFVSDYMREVEQLQTQHAKAQLATRAPSSASFERVVAGFDSDAALLLDGRGKVLAIAPRSPGQVGTQIGDQYDHLRGAINGSPRISDVVESAVRNDPVIAVAVPFESAAGRRVFSVAYDPINTPLGTLLRNTTPITGARVVLLDSKNQIVAANSSQTETRDDTRISSTRAASSGVVGSNYFSVQPVRGTPWRIGITVPTAALYEPLAPGWVWIAVLVMFSLILMATLWLIDRLSVGRRRMSRLAHTDELTQLPNRLATTGALERRLSLALDEDAVAVLMIDVDHFKAINDEFGHHVGDAVLRQTASRMRAALRGQDELGRWGGEEFLAVLFGAGPDEAKLICERLREAVAAMPVDCDGERVIVTVSVGCAQWGGEQLDALVNRADAALYEAKRGGRNVVAVA